MMQVKAALSLVPQFDVTVYIVLDDFGKQGCIYREWRIALLRNDKTPETEMPPDFPVTPAMCGVSKRRCPVSPSR